MVQRWLFLSVCLALPLASKAASPTARAPATLRSDYHGLPWDKFQQELKEYSLNSFKELAQPDF